LVGGLSAFLGFAGYVLAAPNLPAIVSGKVADPISSILQSSLGTVGTKVFLCIALTSFLAGVMSQQASASRLIYSFARDDMFPGARVFNRLSGRHVPLNALVGACVIPVALFVFIYYSPDSLERIAAWQMLAGYLAFQMVVFAALRQRFRGWRPAGAWSLGRFGMLVNVAALAYGVFGMILLASQSPDTSLPFYDRWISLIGFTIVLGVGLAYLFIGRPDTSSDAPEGDAIEMAEKLQALRAAHEGGQSATPGGRAADLRTDR
jgi:amino acid transporter